MKRSTDWRAAVLVMYVLAGCERGDASLAADVPREVGRRLVR